MTLKSEKHTVVIRGFKLFILFSKQEVLYRFKEDEILTVTNKNKQIPQKAERIKSRCNKTECLNSLKPGGGLSDRVRPNKVSRRDT